VALPAEHFRQVQLNAFSKGLRVVAALQHAYHPAAGVGSGTVEHKARQDPKVFGF
jgi:hypothetical protein